MKDIFLDLSFLVTVKTGSSEQVVPLFRLFRIAPSCKYFGPRTLAENSKVRSLVTNNIQKRFGSSEEAVEPYGCENGLIFMDHGLRRLKHYYWSASANVARLSDTLSGCE